MKYTGDLIQNISKNLHWTQWGKDKLKEEISKLDGRDVRVEGGGGRLRGLRGESIQNALCALLKEIVFFLSFFCTADTGGFLSLGISKPSAQSKALASLLLLGKCVVELLSSIKEVLTFKTFTERRAFASCPNLVRLYPADTYLWKNKSCPCLLLGCQKNDEKNTLGAFIK